MAVSGAFMFHFFFLGPELKALWVDTILLEMPTHCKGTKNSIALTHQFEYSGHSKCGLLDDIYP